MSALSRIAGLVPSPTTRGLLLALQSGILFQIMNAAIKDLVVNLPPLFVAWGRWSFGFICIAPFLLRHGWGAVHTRVLHLHVLRALFHAVGYGLWYSAVVYIPLAQTAALGFTGPIFVTLGAALFLGERLRLRRVIAILVGFGGVLVILRPGMVEHNIGALLMLASVIPIAGSNLVQKVVAGRDRPQVVVFWQSLLALILFTPIGIWFWVMPDPVQLALIVLAAALGTTAYLLTTWAMRMVDISTLQPVTFLGIVWAAILDWIMVGKTADFWTFVGAAIVIASTSYIAHREAKLAPSVRS